MCVVKNRLWDERSRKRSERTLFAKENLLGFEISVNFIQKPRLGGEGEGLAVKKSSLFLHRDRKILLVNFGGIYVYMEQQPAN